MKLINFHQTTFSYFLIKKVRKSNLTYFPTIWYTLGGGARYDNNTLKGEKPGYFA